MKKHLLILSLALATSVGTLFAETISGTCGDNLTWTFYEDVGVLIISGTGMMTDYYDKIRVPWYSFRSRLYKISLPSTMQNIGMNAFADCINLTSIKIPNGITSIGSYAFFNCSSLTSIEIPTSVTSIGSSAFSNCSSLTSIEIPTSVTIIGSGAFSNCSGLTSIEIPCNVTSIENSTFQYCSNLTTISIPNSVSSIGKYAFSDCSSLTSIEIPNGVSSIGEKSFMDCSSLASITVAGSVNSIGNYAFSGCSSLRKVILYSNAIVNNSSALTSVFGSQIEEYVLGESVTSIGNGAFSDCSSLTSIEIPNSVTSIGNSAFVNCSLTSIEIPNSVMSIGNNAFNGCRNLTSITIPNGVSSISEGTFYGCSSLTSITIPNSVTNIGNYAFQNCGSLTSITIPNSVTSIGKNAFDYCISLTDIYIPNSVLEIGEYAFASCSSLKEITIPESVTKILNATFSDCNSLTSVTIPKSVTSISNTSFRCKNLTKVILNSNTIVSKNYTPTYSLVQIFGNQVEEYILGESVTAIGNNAFAYCSGLKSITIPKSVTSIGVSAFIYCSSINSIYANRENPPSISNGVFAQCGDLSKIDCYVPQASLELYQNASVWKEFNLIAENNANTHTLTVNANNPQFGSVTGSGTYAEGLDVEITATPNAGYHFVCWNDGNQSATRTVTVSSDATYTALFAADVVPQEEVVTVYAEQTTATITAELIDNDDVESYRFVIYYQGAVFCTCLLDKEGQTLQVDYADNEPNSIPTRLNMPAEALNEANGLNISVSDLQRCATYQFTLDALDADGNILDRRENDFTTTGSVETTDGITVWEDELPYIWEGITFTTAGTETKTLTASTGCDSIVTFTLNVKYHDITLQDNADTDYYTQFAEDYNGQRVNTATLNRQFTQGKWATLCLPFNVNKAMMMSLGLYNRVFEFRYAEQSDDESIQMYFASAQSIEAGKGYIVNPNAKLAAKTSFVFPNVTINTYSDNGDITALTGYNDGTNRGNLFLVGTLRTGILQGTTAGNTYLGLKDNQLYYPNTTSGTSIRAYRGFFRSDVPVNASRVRIIADGETVSELQVVGTVPSDWSDKSDPSYTPARKYIDNGILYVDRNGVTYTAQGQRLD